MRPVLLRPPLLCRGRTSDFSGVSRVISTKSATLEPRRPGVVGLYLRIPIAHPSVSDPAALGDRAPEDLDAVAGRQADDRALGVAALAVAEAGALALALPVERVHVGHRDVEDLLDRDLDLGLVGLRVDEERVLVPVEEAVALLADDRRAQHVAVVAVDAAHAEPPLGPSSLPVSPAGTSVSFSNAA